MYWTIVLSSDFESFLQLGSQSRRGGRPAFRACRDERGTSKVDVARRRLCIWPELIASIARTIFPSRWDDCALFR